MEKDNRYKVAFVDVGGTLLHPAETIGETYSRHLYRFGVECDPHSINERFFATFRNAKTEARKHNTTAYGTTEDSAIAFWRKVFLSCIEGANLTSHTANTVFSSVYEHYGEPEAWQLFPESLEFLQQLKTRRVPIHIVSNWDARLPALLNNMGVTPLVDNVVGSFAMNSEKPAPDIFNVALEGVSAAFSTKDILHIGDNPEEDGTGAQNMGIQFAYINRGVPTAAYPIEVRSLLDLLDYFSG